MPSVLFRELLRQLRLQVYDCGRPGRQWISVELWHAATDDGVVVESNIAAVPGDVVVPISVRCFAIQESVVHARRPLVRLHYLIKARLFEPGFESFYTSEAEQVSDDVGLDFLVQRRVAAQRRCQVDFKQPGLELAIDEDVEAKELETVLALRRTVHLCRVVYDTFATDDSLYDAVLDFLENQHVIMTHSLQSLPQRADAPLGPLVILHRVRVVLKVSIVLI